jgi:N12 class adenine-specific DNA methylase
MAFEDALIGNGDDFDPRTATESLIRQTSPDPLPVTLDPRMLNTRLARKLAEPTVHEPIDVNFDQPKADQPVADFSDQAVPPETPNSSMDFSAQAEPAPLIGPEPPPAAAPGLSQYPIEFGKGVLEGGKNMGAAALKGTAAVGIPTLAPTEMLDELGRAKDMTASQRAKLMGRVLREISDRGLQMDYNAALRRVAQGGDAAKEIETLRPKFEANNKSAAVPVKETGLYKAGQAVEDFGKEALAPAPGFEPGKSWTRDIGAGAGSMAAGIATTMIPGIGPAVGATLFTAAGQGEAADRAVQAGATNDQVRRAALLGGAAGATDVLDAILPFVGSTGRALGLLKRVGLAAVKGALLEGGQEGFQQYLQNWIAQGIYKPDQDLFEDVPRSMAIAAILGGAGGGISGAATRGRDGGSPGLPPPPGGAQPGAAPSPEGPSSPEDIADFVRRAREGAPPNYENNENNENPVNPDPASMSDAERMRAYTASRESHGGASETDILKAAGLDPATMDEQERIDAVIRAAKQTQSETDPNRKPDASGPQQEGLKPKEEASHLHYAVLREYGYSDEDIDNMSASQRKREYADAVAEGIEPGKAMSKHPKRAPKATTESDVGPDRYTQTASAPVDDDLGFGNLGNAGKDVGDSLRDHLWGRLQAGEESEGNGLGKSALLQGAKMIRDRGGFTDRKDFDAYTAEQSKLTPGTPEFQQGMRDLVAKYAKNDTGQNVPESRATLKAQQNQLIKGERVAQMFPKGTREMPLPPGMERVETPRGIFHFNPKKADAASITKASSEGRENELLGLGSFTKEDIAGRAGPELTVVERDADGTEIRAAVGKPDTVEQQRAEMEKGKGPGNTVSIETPQQTLDGRRGKGTRDDLIEIKSAGDVKAVGDAAATDYTPEQGEANNRQLGHAKWNGLPVSIEVAKGGTRKMVNPETGEAVEVTHSGAAYGYFPGTKGADGMHVDIYMGEEPGSPTVYVIDEIDRKSGAFRQHKVMAGFTSERDAFAAYVGTSSKGPETVGAISTMSVPQLKQWFESGDTTRALKPASPGPDKTDEAGSGSRSAEAIEGGSIVPKDTPDAGGAPSVRSEPIIPSNEESSRKFDGNPKKNTVPSVGNRADEPLNLLQFIASRGGLRPDPELSAIGLTGDIRVQIPGRKGFFGLIKATGDSLDNMREAAEEAGYLRGEINKTSTIRDFLDAVDTENRGGEHRAEGEEGKQSKRQRQSLKESSEAARDKAIVDARDAIAEEYTDLPEGLLDAAAEIMADERLDVDSAVEMAAVRAVSNDTDYEIEPNDITATYGEGAFDAIQPKPASEDGGTASPAVEEPGPGESEEAVGDGEPDAPAGTESREAEVNDFIYEIEREIAAGNFDADIAPTRSMKEFRAVAESRGWLHGDYGKGTALWSPDRKHTMLYGAPVEGNHLNVQWGEPYEGVTPPDTDEDDAERNSDYYDNPMQPRLSFEPASDSTIEHYAKVLGIDTKGKKRQWMIEQLLELGARGYQFGGIIAIPRSPAGMADALTASGSVGKLSADLFAELKRSLSANPDKIEPRGDIYETEENGDTWKWKVYTGRGKEEPAYLDFTAYGDHVYLNGGYPGEAGRSYGSDMPKSMVEKMVKAFVKANPPPPPGTEQTTLPAVRDELFIDVGGKRLPMTSYEDASRAYTDAIEQTGATASGRTGPGAPSAIIRDGKGNAVAHISYNGRVWEGGPSDDGRMLYDPVTTEGRQTILPGTERIGHGEQAQRKSDERLKPKVAQKPADDGLFGDSMDQADLLDAAKPQGIEASLQGREPETYRQVMQSGSPKEAAELFARAENYADDSGVIDRVRRVIRTMRSPKSGLTDLENTLTQLRGTMDYIDRQSNNDFEAEIEAVLGEDADKVAQVDIARAAELMADNPDMEPETAFGQAVVINAVEQGFITEQEAEEAYGSEVKPALEAAASGAYPRGSDLEPESLEGRGSEPEAGVVPSSGENVGEEAQADEADSGAAVATGADAAASGEQAAGDQAGDAAQAGPAAETPDNAEWWHRELTPQGRQDALDATGISANRQIRWHYLTQEQQDRLSAFRAEEAPDGISPELSASDAPASPEAVQPVEPGGQAASVSGREGRGGEPAVPRADGERAEGAGRVSEGAGSQRGDRAGDGGDARLSEARADDAPDGRKKRAAKPAADVEGENFVIEPGALDEGRGQKTKAIANVNAIELANKIVAEGRPATAAEQAILAQYVGWGGIKNIFPDVDGNHSDNTFYTLHERLKAALNDEEYATARRSIQYAHYTAEDVVRSMWDAVAKMGFTGGQVFEPGMGVGNFAGMMPADIAANSHYQGVELDHVTARIAKLLYPKYGVRQDDFTKTKLPENSYDLVIGNPPFADVAIKSDPKYKQGFLLHDYFFAKSLDAVRPGGLLAFVTSAGTMNKLDPSAREYLAARADFVGGIRLPGDAFKKNAGTEVTTDILFLRKLLPGQESTDWAWTQVMPVELPGPDGKPIKGNASRYFNEHPEMVLGKPDFADKLYQGRYSVKAIPGSDIKTDLARAISKLPADIMRPWNDVNTEQHQHDFDTTEKKEGTYYVGPDGSLHQVVNGVGQKVGQRGKGVENGRTAADMERIKALIPVRDALRQVYAYDLKGDTGNATRARAQLNKSYDEFVAKHGPINKAVIQTRRPNVIQMEAARAEAREEARYADMPFREGTFDATPMLDAKTPLSVIARERQKAREEAAKAGLPFDEGDFDIDEVPDVVIDKRPNVDPFMDDPESYRIRAIEKYDEGTGIGHKSDVFFKNVISREVVPNISSVNDGLLYSLSQYGRVNIPAIAELTKKTEAEVIEGLGEQVFKVPGTKDSFVTRDEYLSGNVRKKLELAQKAADRNPEFRRNVAALEANQPMPLAPSQIHASLGMPWIPPAAIEKFALDEMGLEKIRVRYTPALASWTVSGDTDSVAARSTWGTEDRRAPAILQAALNRQGVKVYDEVRDADGRKTSQLNVAKTEAANDKLTQMREKFSGWLWADQERSDTLAAFYNENFNNLVVREYDGSYLTTPGIAASWSWRPHQKRVIARIIQSGNTYVAHAVGAGKTSEYIGAIMEMRRLGLVRKPMVAVPNHMLAQFTKEWYEQYPTARLAIADDKRFHTDKRKQFVANVALDDLDAIIITHSAFGMIPVSAEFQNSIIEREINQYRTLLAEIKNEGGDNRITRSRVEKQIERLEQRLVSRTGRKDATFTFEEMGVDHLTVDEAHLFRKLDFSTAMSNLKGVSPEGSQMAWDLYIKSQYLNSIRPGRGLVLGSGTPVTNTMAELYTLSRYMQPDVLAERGLEKFDAWAGAFGESVSELEQDAAGNYKPVSRFAKFVNVAELSAMVRQVMDVVTSKQLSQYVTRPQLMTGKRQMMLAEKSPELVRFQENLAARMKAIQERKGPPAKGDDIMLSVINDGRHAAIDMRLAGADGRSTIPSKLEMMVDNVFDIWQASKRQKFHKVKSGGGYEDKPAMTGPATQLVFTNLGLSGARGFSVPDYIRAELVRRGVPKNEIAYIYDYKSATAKQRLFNDMNEGKVRILIGSVAKMGVGTNVQRRLLAIHNMDPLWYPADDEQRNGRGIRQGNMNPEIGIFDYSTKGTYDSTMWGMMEKKARFIQGFFEGDPSLRDMDDLGEASQYEQAKALTTNDPRLIRFTELKQELERANRRKTAFDSDVYNTRQNRQKAKAQIEHYTQRVENTKKDIAQRIDTRGDKFAGTVGKEKFDKRPDFGVALFERLGAIEDTGSLKGGIKVANVGGFDIYATVHKSNLIKDHTNVDVFMALNGNATREVSYETSSLGTVRSIESIVAGLDSDLVQYEGALAKAQKFFKDSETKANAKFEGDAEIAALKKQVDDLAAELAKPAEEVPAAPTTEEGPSLASLSDYQATLTPLADEKHAEISEMLTAIVRAVAGDVPKVEFHKGLIPVKPPPGYPAGISDNPMAAGQYGLGTAIIRLALTSNAEQMASTAFHESYHHVEDRLLSKAELKLMREETERLRAYIKGKTGLTDKQVDGLAGFEVRAIAFQTYASDRVAGRADAGKGIHIGVRRWFERLMELLRKIMNGLNGLGFHTYKDVFNDVFTGKVAARRDRGQGGIHEAYFNDLGSLAALHDAVGQRIANVGKKMGVDFTELRVQVQDKFIRIRHAEESVGGVPSRMSAYQAEQLYYGRTGEQLEQLEKNTFDPLIKDMKARNISLPEINDFLYARHAPERNLAMDAINHPDMIGGRDLRGRGSGMSDEEAQQIMDDIAAAGRMDDFEAIEARVRNIIADTREYLVATGLISEEMADAWANKYQFYVPLRGFEEGTEDDLFVKGQGFDTRARESQEAMGRLSKAAGPLPYVMMQAEMAIVRGEKNKVGNTALRFFRANPDPRRWTVNQAKTKRVIDPFTGLVTQVADTRQDPFEFITKVGGQRMVIRFEGKDGQNLARALKNMGTSNLNGVLRLMHNVTTTMARLSTQWNPNFTVPNFARDVGEAFINLQAQQQQNFVKSFAKHLPRAIGGSFLALRGKQGGTYAQAFREFDADGGRIRFFGLENHEDVARNIAKKLRRLDGGIKNGIIQAGERAADAMEVVNGSIENATRLAAYMAARDVGMSRPDAARLALNLTTNFTKKGELGSAISSLWMFANAAIQGTTRVAQALKHPKVQKAVFGLVIANALATLFSVLAGGDDESGENYYAKIPHYIRDKNMIFMWPKGMGHDGEYLKIPLPYGFSPFAVLGERLVTVALGKDKPGDAAAALLKSIGDAMNPLGEESSSLLSLLPTVFRAPAHIGVNKNWTGNPLYPEREWDKAKPDSEQYFRTNSEFSKAAAREVNKLGGGSPYQSSGWLDWHPGSIDHVIETLTGGLGKFVGDVVKTGGGLYKSEPFDPTKAPIIRRFYGSSGNVEADASSYYRAREESRKIGGEAIRNARKDRAKGVNVDEADSFLKNNSNLIRADDIFKNADQAMKPLRERRERTENSKELDQAAKREALKKIEADMRAIQNRARKQYQELKAGARAQ